MGRPKLVASFQAGPSVCAGGVFRHTSIYHDRDPILV